MRWLAGIGALAAGAAAALLALRASQAPPVIALDEAALREYTGAYRWGPDAFLYLQMWNEFTGFNEPGELVSFDESGDVRTLYPTGPDRFFAGPAAADPRTIESRVEFQRDAGGRIVSLTWRREGAPPRTATRALTERHEDVRFPGSGVALAGTLVAPARAGRHPAAILVHGSGAENREYVLPWARFLVRRGIAVLAYDKRGVGRSTGDWKTASFDDLAADVVAAFHYLRTRPDIDGAQVGLLGISQAGWIMPRAAVRAPELAFLISISGGAVTPAETALDHARSQMTGRGMKPQMVADVIHVMTLQYEFARTGRGWEDYAEARKALAARMGPPPDTLPGTRDHPYWESIRRFYFDDPAPALRRLRVPVLALFGERDDNILPAKNKAAWQAGLEAGGHPDYTLQILPNANHPLFETIGDSAGTPNVVRRFVPAYFTTVEKWLAARVTPAASR